MAVKVTLLPAQMVVADAAMLTLTGKFGLTVIVIPELVTGLPVKQGVAFDVNTTDTTFPFVSVEVVKVLAGPFVPTFKPLSLH